MTNTRRSGLAQLRAETPHTGLWLDRYITDCTKEAVGAKATVVHEATSIPIPALYPLFYQRWHASLQALAERPDWRAAHYSLALCQASVIPGSRLAIGLGQKGVVETSLALHRTYGVPYIPGSALKGLAATYARQYAGDGWKADQESYQTLFGFGAESLDAGEIPTAAHAGAAGFITFFDALYIPGTGSGTHRHPLHPDVITVHHPKYYQDERNPQPPADWDSPVPVPFISASGSYLIALGGPHDWVEIAVQLLKEALLLLGIGGKTASGYGRMTFDRERDVTFFAHHSKATLSPTLQRLYDDRLAAIRSSNKGNLNDRQRQIRTLELPDAFKYTLLVEAKLQAERLFKPKELIDKSWYQELCAYLKEQQS